MPDLEQLKSKYQSALTAIQQQGVRLAHMHIQDGKLFLQGEAPSEQAKNEVWNKVKAVDPSYSDLTLDLKSQSGPRERTTNRCGRQRWHADLYREIR